MKNINHKRIIMISTAAVLLASMAAVRADLHQDTDMIAADQTLRSSSGLAFAFKSGPREETQTSDDKQPASTPSNEENNITIRSVEPVIEPDTEEKQAREFAWLGLGVKESPEVLSAQLGLKSGEGLTVTFLAPDSPAAKAGFQKNDVLVDFDGQMLVHPLQLRKLVRMHSEGDTVKLTFYRGGKKLTSDVKLGKTSSDQSFDSDDESMPPALENLHFKLDGLNGKLHVMEDSLSRAGVDKGKIDGEIQRAMAKASRAMEDAMRQESKADRDLAQTDHDLEALAHASADVDGNATVTVRNGHKSSSTIVRTDDTGSIVLEAGAKTHLTARDKDGKLLFDGNISTSAEQKKVPKEVWAKVKPMLDQLH